MGLAGLIYGNTQRNIHFEIVRDDANIRRLVGRDNGCLDLTHDGRTDAVYGASYFLLPASKEIFGRDPIMRLLESRFQPLKPNRNTPVPPSVPIMVAATTDRLLVVEMRFVCGEGN